MVAKRRHGIDDVDNIPPKIPRMRGSKPHPPNPRDRSESRQQLGKAFLSIRIAVRIHVLPEELNLRISQVRQLPRFVQHRRRSPAPLLAARIGHHAVSAEFVAALNNSDVPAMRISPSRELRLEALISQAIIKPGNPLPASLQLHQHLRKLAIRSRPAHQRYIRRPLKNLFPLLLRHASQDAKLFPLRTILLIIREPVKDLLLRLVANRAGVIKDQPRLFHRWNLPIPLLQKRPHHLLGVVRIHLAAEGLKVKRLAGGVRHGVSINQQLLLPLSGG